MDSTILEKIRANFPALQQEVYGRPLVYLDNGATTQKPIAVIERIATYYKRDNSNIHRGAHFLANKSTVDFEEGRAHIQQFINAKHAHEIIFTRGTTESINLLANSFADRYLNKGDEILITAMEHHANIVPWQMVCEKKGAHLKVVPMNKKGVLNLAALDDLLTSKTKLFAFTHVSNALGTVNPVKLMIEKAHQKGVPVLVDGAQAVPHTAIDVQQLDCEFYCFSGHKMYAPMGIGIVYGKEAFLNEMPPYQGGGEMIKEVTFEKTTYNELPYKFEAGTPNVSGVLGLSEAISFMQEIGIDNIQQHEHHLLEYAIQELKKLGGITFIGEATQRAGVVSFLIDGVHPYDAGTIIDRMGVAVRTGHHCAQPIMDFLAIPGTIRASFAVYNNEQDVDALIKAIDRVKQMFL